MNHEIRIWDFLDTLKFVTPQFWHAVISNMSGHQLRVQVLLHSARVCLALKGGLPPAPIFAGFSPPKYAQRESATKTTCPMRRSALVSTLGRTPARGLVSAWMLTTVLLVATPETNMVLVAGGLRPEYQHWIFTVRRGIGLRNVSSKQENNKPGSIVCLFFRFY